MKKMSSWKKICFICKTNVIIRAGNEFTCHVLQYIIVYLGNMKNPLPDELEATLLEGKYLHVIPCGRAFYRRIFLHNMIGF